MKDWTIIYRPRYAAWFGKCGEQLQNEILAYLEVLKTMGPNLGRPQRGSYKRLETPEYEGAANSV
jgi:hypothetical protein